MNCSFKQLRIIAVLRIESSNPKAILARGYSVVTDNSGKIIRSTDELSEGLGVNIETGNGTAEAVITGIKKG